MVAHHVLEVVDRLSLGLHSLDPPRIIGWDGSNDPARCFVYVAECITELLWHGQRVEPGVLDAVGSAQGFELVDVEAFPTLALAFYQARNPGLAETLGSGTRYSTPCILSAYVAIEQAAIEFGVGQHIDTLIRIAACESALQPTMVERADPADVGVFQWNDRSPSRWWTKARTAFNAWQDRKARSSGGAYAARYATNDRTDPYNSARVAAWTILMYPRNWPKAWHCKGVYDPKAGRLR
jgi:hypothetical protein